MKKGYKEALHEDIKIRTFLKKQLGTAGVSSIEIERKAGKVRIQIFTARPGIIIGRRGQEIDRIKDEVSKLTQAEIIIDIKEVKVPQTDGQLVAENIALQLEKRVAFRKAMKKAITGALGKGAGGIKVICKGRLGGNEIARSEGYREGKVPLGTFRANIDYGFAEAFTTYGTIGVKVWIYHGDILVKKEQAERMKQKRQKLELIELEKSEAQAQKTETPASSEAAPAVPAEVAKPALDQENKS